MTKTPPTLFRTIFGPGWLGNILVLLAGVPLTFAFAPFGLYLFAFICPALLLCFWLLVKPAQAFWRGLLFGIGFFGSGVSWVYISIHVYGNTAAPVAAAFTALFVTVLALFLAIQGYLFARFFPKNNASKCLLAFPAIWVLFELLRTWLFTGFPWLFLGYSQIHTALRGYAPFVSVYGISFLVCLTSGLLVASLFVKQRIWFIQATIVFGLWLLGIGLSQIHWNKPIANPITFSVIQGNIPQELKWDPQAFNNTLKLYRNLTARHWQSRLIVWPEAAIPIPLNDVTTYVQELSDAAKQNHSAIITGVPIQANPEGSFYNAMITLGDGHGTYFKRHLVPFGEYVPFESLLRGLFNFLNLPMSNLISGPALQNPIEVNGARIAPFICYEIAYPIEVQQTSRHANMLLTISDDSWFGRSIAQAQHLQMAQMRSIETAKPQIFSSNDGITALINSNGIIVKKIPPFTTAVLNGEITPMQGTTPWMILGILPLIGLLTLLLLIALSKQNSLKSNNDKNSP